MHVHVYIRSRNRLKVNLQQLLKRLSLRQLELHGTKRASTYLCSCGYEGRGTGTGTGTGTDFFPQLQQNKMQSHPPHSFC